jgi:UDP-GlcNAc:undecaprenyl-phosphate GlcNAc-1-phosphate transferase
MFFSMTGLGTFLFSFLTAYVGTLLLLKVRVKGRFVDVPSERSSHDVVKPRFGGIALVSSFFLVFGFLLAREREMSGFLPFLAGAALIFVAGVLDDRRSLPVVFRLMAQIAATVILVRAGNVVDHIYVPLAGTIELDVLSVPFTILFILASINFYNFIDGIDGLAAGSACIVSGFLALIAYMLGHGALALVCLAVAGSSLGFLQFNFPPSRLFMGDGGSTFLGYFFAFAAITGNRLVPEMPFFITVLLLSSLYLDAGVTLLRRLFRGEKILQPHRTHYYQRLLALGFNHKQVTVLEYGLTILLGTSALIFFKAGGFFPIFLCVCWLAVFTSLMLKVRGLERGDRLFWERRTVLVVCSDILLVAVAYYAAYFLRLGFLTSGTHWGAVVKAFPIVLVVRSACFYWYGLYRGMWKYTSTPDIVKLIKAVTVGSAVILMLLVFFYRFVAFPRSMFVIEYFLLIVGLAGTRFASRLFHEFGKEAAVSDAKRVAILGAGDVGEQLLREIRGTEGKRCSVVCFIDNDKEKDGLTLQGIPITGPIERLGEICRRHEVDSIVLGIPDPVDPEVRSIIRAARESGIEVDTRGAAVADTPVLGPVLFDRISRDLERPLPSRPSDAAKRFYRDKRVLVTNGGEILGPALVRELIELGADVTVHIASTWEKERFSDIETDRLSFRVGAFDRETDVTGILEASSPCVIFHTVPLRAEGIANEAGCVWRRGVRGSGALCKALARFPVESLVLVELWENVRPDDRWALLAAMGETLVLNDSGLVRSSPKVVRLPSILTEHRLRRIIRSVSPAGSSEERFDILESEAAAILLNVGSVCAGRMMVVPAAARAFGPEDIDEALNVRTFPAVGAEARDRSGARRPLFPSETPRPSVIPGANEVVSPLYPASESLLREVSECQYPSGTEALEECLRDLAAELFPRVEDSRAVRSSID